MATQSHADDKAMEQFLTIRDSGITNMMDRQRVQQLAIERDMYALIAVADDPKAYMALLMRV
jgi:hypothetical protein